MFSKKIGPVTWLCRKFWLIFGQRARLTNNFLIALQQCLLFETYKLNAKLYYSMEEGRLNTHYGTPLAPHPVILSRNDAVRGRHAVQLCTVLFVKKEQLCLRYNNELQTKRKCFVSNRNQVGTNITVVQVFILLYSSALPHAFCKVRVALKRTHTEYLKFS